MNGRLGQYELLRPLGQGAVGEVYLARHVEVRRLVALKLLRQVDERSRSRFATEAQAVARLRHPHIVQLHEAHFDGSQPFFVMQYIEGESLQEKLERERALPPQVAIEIALRLADALSHAHEQGILHRDLKPANVLLDQAGAAFLTDFGLAKDLASSREALTRTGQIVGTPAFMAPEQATGARELIGPTTDVYGLGATLYAMLSGRPPHERTNMMALVAAVAKEEPTALRTLRPDLDPGLEAVVRRALSKSPSLRYATVRELAEDLQRVLGGERPRAQRGAWGLAWGAALVVALGLGAWYFSAAPARVALAPAPRSSVLPRPAASTSQAPRRSPPIAARRWARTTCRDLIWTPSGLLALTWLGHSRRTHVLLRMPFGRRELGQIPTVVSARSILDPFRRACVSLSGSGEPSLSLLGGQGVARTILIRGEAAAWVDERAILVSVSRAGALLSDRRGHRAALVDLETGESREVSVGPGGLWPVQGRLQMGLGSLSPDGRFLIGWDGRFNVTCVDLLRGRATAARSVLLRLVVFVPGAADEALLFAGNRFVHVQLPSLRVVRTVSLTGLPLGRSVEAVVAGRDRIYIAAHGLHSYRPGSSGPVEIQRFKAPVQALAADAEETRLFYATARGVTAVALPKKPN